MEITWEKGIDFNRIAQRCHSSPLPRSKFYPGSRWRRRTSLPLHGPENVNQRKNIAKPSEYYFFQLQNIFSLASHYFIHDIWKEVFHTACLKGNPFGNMGKAQSRADLWHHCRHYRKHQDQAGETPQCSPEAAFQPVNKSCGLGILLWTQHAWTACPCRNLWQHFPVRDLGSGDTGFLLRHHDVTMRVGTGPRKTSSWTGSTLV